MTIASDVKQCLANLNGIIASLSSLAIKTQDEQAARDLHESMLTVTEVVEDIKNRVGELEREEIQYKGF
ncbi:MULTISPECIES: DUF1657 domain-containing protein [Bacillus]|uniref:DUF1657 domain-containing protein n=1 Tax=Bacillus TaxID=1386 RepID=UPI0002E4875B|nr:MULTISPECIES: DUF1657 domain-containing protein [Bacillus]